MSSSIPPYNPSNQPQRSSRRSSSRGRRGALPTGTPSGTPNYPDQAVPPAYNGQPYQGYPSGTQGYGYPPQNQRRVRRWRRQGCAVGPGCILGCVGLVGLVMMSVLIAGLVVWNYYSNRLDDEIDKMEDLTHYESFETTVIYDRNGGQLYQILGEGWRTKIPLDQIPIDLIHATIAVEDDTFYDNEGIDLPSIARGVWQYARHGYIVSGGSTITQQLIRNVLFTEEYKYEISLNRKIDEALLAMILTRRMSKDEILEMYLNEIPYGNLAYGIEAAAQIYFGKHASELTLAESALLAGLPQAPAGLDPLNPDPNVQSRVNERRKLVLDLMVQEDYITRAEANAAYAEQLAFVMPDVELDSAPHFVLYAKNELETLLERQLNLSPDEIQRMVATGGLRVYTTIDMNYQQVIEAAARQQIAQMKSTHNMNNAAVVVLRPETGEILAMLGSVDYSDETIDGNVNVAIAARQPGSAMKPFTYASALEQGWSPATVLWDTETVISSPGMEAYSPVNYDGTFHGPVRLREALANSYNIPAVQTLRYVGVDYLLWMMNRVGVVSLGSDSSQYGLALTLGGGALTPLELTTAYSVLANSGYYVPNTSILCVTNSDNEIIYEYERRCPSTARLSNDSQSVLAQGQQVLDARIAFVLSDILADNNARTPAMGSNSALYTPGIPTSVKTGTTNDYHDNWTVGYTRNIAVGVWTGNTDYAAMYSVSGLDGAAPIWHDVITGIYGNQSLLDVLGTRQADDAHLQPPGGVSLHQLCGLSRTSLHDPALGCASTFSEWLFDSQAVAPDASGMLVPIAATEVLQQSANGPQPVEIEPGLIRVAVVTVNPDLANAVAASDMSGLTAPPKYCQVPIEIVGQVPGVQEQVFITPPYFPDDAVRARVWANNNGVAILPQFACDEQMIQTSSGSGYGPTVVTANILSPTSGQTFSTAEQINVIGNAIFTQDQAWYYKVEIRGGQFGDWATIGNVDQPRNYSGVTNGVLVEFGAYALPPSTYTIQLIIIGKDGNYLQAPYQVTFNVQ